MEIVIGESTRVRGTSFGPSSENCRLGVDDEDFGDDDDDDDIVLIQEKLSLQQTSPSKPPSGLTSAVPRLRDDIEALITLAQSDTLVRRRVRSLHTLTVYYGFGNASSNGFGVTVESEGGIQTRYGLWGRDEENESSIYQELLNLVETIEELGESSLLKGVRLWIFTDNSTTESCFHTGSSS